MVVRGRLIVVATCQFDVLAAVAVISPSVAPGSSSVEVVLGARIVDSSERAQKSETVSEDATCSRCNARGAPEIYWVTLRCSSHNYNTETALSCVQRDPSIAI